MIHRKSLSLWLLLTSVTLFALALAACSSDSDTTTTPEPTAAAMAASPSAEGTVTAPATPEQGIQPPFVLRIDGGAPRPLPAQCQRGGDQFKLASAPLPLGGLDIGKDYQFCATGVAAGTPVVFELTGPADEQPAAGEGSDESKRSYRVEALALENGAVAPLLLRLLPEDMAGEWTLTARTGDVSDEVRFRVRELKDEPMIALKEPLGIDPKVARAEVGGMAPGGTGRFVLYSVKESPGDDDALEADFLISIGFEADAGGRADIELDVADLPEGSYMLMVLPEGKELGDPASLRFPNDQRLAVVTKIARAPTSGVAGPAEEASPSGEAVPSGGLPAAVSSAPTAGGLPETIQVSLPATELPACTAVSTPTLLLSPSRGEIGNWWLGCAQGFKAGDQIDLTVTLPNGKQTVMPITAGPEGAKEFRWYSAPGEGAGTYRATAKSTGGQEASVSWTIAAPTGPHLLVFPHQVESTVGSFLNIAGFPANANVDLALYRLNDQGQGTRVRTWQVAANKFGAAKVPFEEAFGLEPGQYAVVAQGGPAFAFPGIDIAASAVDFFGYNQPLDERYDFYTLYLGRTENIAVAATAKPAVASTATAAPTATPAATPVPAAESTAAAPAETPAATPALISVATPTVEAPATAVATPVAASGPVPPAAITLPEDTSGRPSCPGAGSAPTICLLPAIVPRGTFAYLVAHGFPAGTPFEVVVTMPKGQIVTIEDVADSEGFADFHWYALNDEPLGVYSVTARGGNRTFNGSFEVVKPTSPQIVVEPRAAVAGIPVKVSLAGFQPAEDLILARYRGSAAANGEIDFALVDSTPVKTGAGGGAQVQLATTGAQNGELYLLTVFRPGQATELAKAAYIVGEPLFLRYPFAWGQNFQEGQ